MNRTTKRQSRAAAENFAEKIPAPDASEARDATDAGIPARHWGAPARRPGKAA